MSRTFKDSIDADLAAVFFNTDEFAESVTISRGASSTPGVAAIRALRSYEVADDGGVMTAIQSHDWDVIATDYRIAAAQAAPRAGDRVTDGESVVYEVLPIKGRQCYEPTGGDGKVWRVHTKRVS